ncbi:hypothetical protein Taro_013062, partial [Colocasia esculenta]|nr:hypothetical protein [Colocasia esculenta]
TPDCCFGNPFLGAIRGGTVGCSSFFPNLVACPRCRMLFLPNLVEVQDVGACVVRLGFHVVAPVFRKLLCLGECVPRCGFRNVFDSAGSAGVVFGLTRVVVEAFLCFHCFVVLYSRVFGSVGGGATFEGPWRGSGRSGHYSGIRAQRSNEICNELITMAVPRKGECLLLLLGARATSVVAIFARAVVGFVLGLRAHVGVSRRLREPACGVVFTGAGLLPVDLVEVGIFARAKQMLVLPEFFSVGSGGGEVFPRIVWCSFLVVAALPSGLRSLLSGWLAVAFWWVFPEWCLGGSGGERLLALWVEVLPKLPCVGVVPLTVCLAVVLASLVSAMGVWLVVLLWKCQSHVVVSPCVWKRLIGAHCCDLLVESSSLGLDCCVQSARLLLVKVVDLDPVCGPVFGQFVVVVRLAVSPMGLCLEALVAIWCVALSACGGRSGASCCAFLRANMVVALLKLLVLRVFLLVWVSGGESLLVGHESFQAVGAVVYYTLSVFPFDASGGESFLLAWVVSAAGATVLHPAEFCLVCAAPVELSTSTCVLCALVVRPVSRQMSVHSLCGKVVVLITRKSCVATELPVATTRVAGGSERLSDCRGILVGHVLVAVGVAVALRSRSGGRRLNALAGSPFPLFFPFSFPSSSMRREVFFLPWRSGGGSCGAVARCRGSEEVAAVVSFPVVCLPSDVVTVERIATSVEASPRRESTSGMPEVWTVCPPLRRLWRWLGCSCCDVASHAVFELVFSCVLRCGFRNVFDSAGSAGVVFGLTRVVVEVFLCFCCFVVLYSRFFRFTAL